VNTRTGVSNHYKNVEQGEKLSRVEETTSEGGASGAWEGKLEEERKIKKERTASRFGRRDDQNKREQSKPPLAGKLRKSLKKRKEYQTTSTQISTYAHSTKTEGGKDPKGEL